MLSHTPSSSDVPQDARTRQRLVTDHGELAYGLLLATLEPGPAAELLLGFLGPVFVELYWCPLMAAQAHLGVSVLKVANSALVSCLGSCLLPRGSCPQWCVQAPGC